MRYRIPISGIIEFGDLYYYGDKYYKRHCHDMATRKAWAKKKAELSGPVYSGEVETGEEETGGGETSRETEPPKDSAPKEEPVRGRKAALQINPEEVRRLYLEDGWTKGQLADYFHCPLSHMEGFLKRNGIHRQVNSKTYPFTPEEIRELYETGNISKKEVAAKYGVTMTQMDHFMFKHGIKKRKEKK